MRLQQEFNNAVRLANYSLATERSYWGWVRQFLHFHNMRHPSEMGGPEISQFLSHLVLNKNVAVNTQKQALNALIFLYKHALKFEEIDVTAWQSAKLVSQHHWISRLEVMLFDF